ncbi:MAG TPA: UDP-glucose/GDP-mannose dehydrogenase family protein, partial [Candidatus Eisenbacteria bacterium]|nr:UDP-glucose/GDP-mannose dehydrogenase family protein [Candidatus Eisenbacteria bacterium]
GNEVLCVDIDPEKIATLERGEIPFYEPGLQHLVARNVRERRLRFGTSLAEATAWGEVIFICVGTPSGPKGEAVLTYVFDAAKTIARSMPSYRLVVQKSTVPVGTGAKLQAFMKKHAKKRARFDVASNPEFLREGTAVDNFMRPDRIVIGAESAKAKAVLRDLYRPLYLIETPSIVTDIKTAELIKYAANAFLATKISYINEMANLADALGANVHHVAKAMGLDRRIGSKFLHPGPGYGGSCLPKDTKALRHFATEAGVPMRVVSASIDANDAQLDVAVKKIQSVLHGRGKKVVALLGLAFKPETDDMRAAPSLGIVQALRRRGIAVRVYDPVVRETTFGAPKGVIWAGDVFEAVRGADAVAIVTEWNEFRRLDLAKVRRLMRRRAIVDLRNVYEPETVARLGFEYVSVGRPA